MGDPPELADQRLVDALAQPFHIRRMHQKLGTIPRQAIQFFFTERDLGELPPFVSHYHIILALPAAAQVQDQVFPAHGPG